MGDKRLCENQFTVRYLLSLQNRFDPVSVPFTSDTLLLNSRAVFSKGFSHPDDKGPSGSAYSTFVSGLQNRNFQNISSVNNTFKRIVDSYCVCDYELMGKFKSCFTIQPSPNALSEHAAAELVEVYNMAVARDVKISEWNTSPIITEVLASLNLVKQNLDGPLENGNITVNTLFRGSSQGDLIGPYVSQFLFYPITIGAFTIDQKYVSPAPNVDYLTTVSSFLNAWNGAIISPTETGNTRYLITIRDCANYIHLDQMWQPFYMAASILQNLGIPLSGPTVASRTGAKFINLGAIDLFTTMVEAGKLAMNATWSYKYNQLRYRPEEMAYQVHLTKTDSGLAFPNSLLSNPVLQKIYDANGNYLMPQAYKEGSPAHPSFPSGHATLAGSMITIIKAFFKITDTTTIRAKIPNSDGSELQDYLVNGQPVFLKVNDELDKLASNCGIFRNLAGIHYRRDAEDGILLGEKVAIQLLQELCKKYSSDVTFTLKKRDGTTITIKNN
jgi:membrane-associated phospholipid phosphatase